MLSPLSCLSSSVSKSNYIHDIYQQSQQSQTTAEDEENSTVAPSTFPGATCLHHNSNTIQIDEALIQIQMALRAQASNIPHSVSGNNPRYFDLSSDSNHTSTRYYIVNQ